MRAFFAELGERRHSIRAISIDMNGGYEKAIRDQQATDDQFRPEVCSTPSTSPARRPCRRRRPPRRVEHPGQVEERPRPLVKCVRPSLSLKPFVKLARTIRRHRDGILAAIRLGLSNSRMEALNSKVRLLSHRSFGFHEPQPLIALIYLCCTGLPIHPPQR